MRDATRALLLCGLLVGAPARGEENPDPLKGRCASGRGLSALVSPQKPATRGALRVLVVSEKAVQGARLLAKGPGGPLELKVVQGGGPPHWWFARIERAAPGRYRFALVDGEGKGRACARAWVGGKEKKASEVVSGDPPWPVKRGWTRRTENLYSAWIEKLFDAPPDQRPTWRPLHQVLRDPERNALYNHLGASEDGPDERGAVVVRPDCADLPYFLRAYFAWKLRLPMGYRHCSRGTSRRPPRCEALRSNLSEGSITGTPAKRFSHFLRRRVSYVHSGGGQTAPEDDETDFYPIKLSKESIRPGSVYVDPSGHQLVVAKWVAQSAKRSGQLFLIESQPDETVGRKRFWRGAFQFIADTKSGGSGFKAFRPLRVKEGQVVALTNDEIRRDKSYGNYSRQQYELGEEGFFERMDRVINPDPLSPLEAYHEQLVAMFELIQKRRDSVATGEDYVKKPGAKVIPMPRGPSIFQTTGPWEDYSTPARDFRMLVAMDQVLGFPKKVAAEPGRFALPAGKDGAAVQEELRRLAHDFTTNKTITYTRSDGSPWTLTMDDVLRRRKGLEMAYNPNDCIELRWAATEPKELATCTRHAPAEQRRRMAEYRVWFASRKRPSLR